MADTAWIIGASSGIGKDLAIQLSNQGYNVILSARSEDGLISVKNELNKQVQSWIFACDVAKKKSVEQTFDQINLQGIKPNLVVFAAGIYQQMALVNYDHELCLNTLSVNLIGAFNVFDGLKKWVFDTSHHLHLVWIASVAGYIGLPNSGAYSPSKAALINFAQIQKAELEKFNNKIQVVNPGFVKTRLTDKNKFPMPFIIDSSQAANLICKGLKSKRFEIAFPAPFIFIMRVLKLLPNKLYFYLVQKIKNIPGQ